MPIIDLALASEQYCYLTTRGRRSGNPHTIEIWFGLAGDTLYMLSGGRDRSDWVRNLKRNPGVSVRIGSLTYTGQARIIAPEGDEDALARRLLLEKYAPGYSGSLSDWGRTALPIAIEIESVEG
jgi:deazaflavin-dependent oxidoreductase (nitroreductase family)